MSSDNEPLVPEEFKPVAVVICAQTGDQLKWIGAEATDIVKTLEDRGFNVQLLSQPNPNDIIDLFSAKEREDGQSFHNRIAVFHFAGHSSEQSLALLPKWKEATEKEDAKLFFPGLAEFLQREECLRLIFINGCKSEGFDRFFNSQSTACILANSPIPDEAAQEFSTNFYEQWDGKHSVDDAFQFVKNSKKARVAPDPTERNMLDEGEDDRTESFFWQTCGKTETKVANCFTAVFSTKLKEKSAEWTSKLPSKKYQLFFLACFFIGLVSLLISYVWPLSSPAFQASFGYAFSDAEFEGPNVILSDLVKAGDGRQRRGFYIELVRLFLGLVILYSSLWLLGSPFDLKNLRPRTKWLLIGFFVFTVITLTFYHYVKAPFDLATNTKFDNKWLVASESGEQFVRAENAFYGDDVPENPVYLCLDEDIWRNAGAAWDGTRFDEFEDAINKPSEDETEFQNKMESLSIYNQMFVYPYLAYSPYSIILFCIVAQGIFFVIVIHTLSAKNKILFLLDATINSEQIGSYRNERYKNEQKIILDKVYDVMRSILSRYSVFLCLLVVGMCYETGLGFLTLAPTAKMMSLIALALLFSGLISIAYAFFVYNEKYQQLTDPPESSKKPQK